MSSELKPAIISGVYPSRRYLKEANAENTNKFCQRLSGFPTFNQYRRTLEVVSPPRQRLIGSRDKSSIHQMVYVGFSDVLGRILTILESEEIPGANEQRIHHLAFYDQFQSLEGFLNTLAPIELPPGLDFYKPMLQLSVVESKGAQKPESLSWKMRDDKAKEAVSSPHFMRQNLWLGEAIMAAKMEAAPWFF